MHIEIISTEKVLYIGNSDRIQLPGSTGSFELLNNHAPIVSTLKQGKIKLKAENGANLTFDIQSGIVEVHKNQVSVLIESI